MHAVHRRSGGGAAASASGVWEADGSASAGLAEEGEEQQPLLEGVAFHALDSRVDGVLWDVAPAHVIMYDSDIAFVRQLEVRP